MVFHIHNTFCYGFTGPGWMSQIIPYIDYFINSELHRQKSSFDAVDSECGSYFTLQHCDVALSYLVKHSLKLSNGKLQKQYTTFK